MSTRKLRFGFVLHGVGAGWGDWRHEAAVTDASVNFNFYREQAQLAEQGGLQDPSGFVARLNRLLMG